MMIAIACLLLSAGFVVVSVERRGFYDGWFAAIASVALIIISVAEIVRGIRARRSKTDSVPPQ